MASQFLEREGDRVVYVVLSKYARSLLGQSLDELLYRLGQEHPIVVVDSIAAVRSFRKISESSFHPSDSILAIGGDGTVNLVLNTPAGSLPMAILPLGTANDLATFLRLPRTVSGAVSALKSDRIRRLDTLRVNGRAFCTSGGLGLPRMTIERVSRFRDAGSVRVRAVHRLGALAYWLAAARSIVFAGRENSREWDIAYRSPETGTIRKISACGSGLIVSNQPLLAKNLRISPTSNPEDGVFEIVILKQKGRIPLLGLLSRLACGGKPGKEDLAVIPAEEATIQSGVDESFFGDGEILVRDREFKIEIAPASLQVLSPE